MPNLTWPLLSSVQPKVGTILMLPRSPVKPFSLLDKSNPFHFVHTSTLVQQRGESILILPCSFVVLLRHLNTFLPIYIALPHPPVLQKDYINVRPPYNLVFYMPHFLLENHNYSLQPSCEKY